MIFWMFIACKGDDGFKVAADAFEDRQKEFHQGGIFSLPPSETLTLLMAFVPERRSRNSYKVGEIDLKDEQDGVLNLIFSTGQLQQVRKIVSHRAFFSTKPPFFYDDALKYSR